MRYKVPKGSPMMVSTADFHLKHHVSKHAQFFNDADEFKLEVLQQYEKGTQDMQFTFLDGKQVRASKLMKARFRMFGTNNPEYPYVFVIPESIEECHTRTKVRGIDYDLPIGHTSQDDCGALQFDPPDPTFHGPDGCRRETQR